MKKVKVGVIGTGQIGKRHIEGYCASPDVEIVGVADTNEAEAKKVAEANNIKYVYKDFRDLLKINEIQAVDVCLHNNLHAPVAIAAMEAGKDVYCEKPLAGSYIDAKAMIDSRNKTKRKLYMQVNSLFSKETRAAKVLIENGNLGKIYYAKSSYYRRRGRPYVDGYGTSSFVQKKIAGGGALFDVGIYHIIQALYLIDNPSILTVSGATYQEVPMYEDRRKSGNYDVEEFASGFIRLKNNIGFYMDEAWAVHLGNAEGIKIMGSKGGITLNPFAFHTTVSDLEMDGTFNLGDIDNRWHMINPNQEGYDNAQKHWIAVLQDRIKLIDTAELGLSMMKIAEGIYLSEKLKKEVTSEEIEKASVSTALKGL